VLHVELSDERGIVGIGEAAPTSRFGGDVDSVEAAIMKTDLSAATFDASGDVRVANCSNPSGRVALETALLDGVSRKAGLPLDQFLRNSLFGSFEILDLPKGRATNLTSVSIGIDTSERIEEKVRAVESAPILKIKLGAENDSEILHAVRAAAPEKTIRVDANGGWDDPELALLKIQLLAQDGNIEFVEQPMSASRSQEDWQWLAERSPLPLFADESCVHAADVARLHGVFAGVNVKLVKAGGVLDALATLIEAKKAGLKTMLGCMIESSLGVATAFHLSPFADYLDLDSPLLLADDPFEGFGICDGRIEVDTERPGIGVRWRAGESPFTSPPDPSESTA
jgi:L-alanine-DL-glutamate epimerase-like enolase superfamily enzyme